MPLVPFLWAYNYDSAQPGHDPADLATVPRARSGAGWSSHASTSAYPIPRSTTSCCRPSGVLAPGHGTTARCLPWCLASDSLQPTSKAFLAAKQSRWRRFCVTGGEIWILLSGESVAASKRIWRATIYRCRLSSGSSSQFGMIAESSTARAATVATMS
ncbi:hypothetical protein BD626DRAFT_278774 [Schizophyllum amplum]|uniref:Uncharacterized protein n=1 Tax=Schizophyllum amplum TaxID=97359 RepID=A0A550BTC1_9AGAR|nr:hypothetical protein BD626DRAFT_278774 [Auriculariopsis ampla]